MDAPSLESFKARLDGALSNLVSRSYLDKSVPVTGAVGLWLPGKKKENGAVATI